MSCGREEHHRRSIRLATWDYGEQGAYFITICTHDRSLLFEDGELRAIVAEVWENVAWANERTPDKYVVMPNHVHGIIWLPGPTAVGAQQPSGLLNRPCSGPTREGMPGVSVAAPLRGLDLGRRVESGSLAAIVRTFKAATAKRINNVRGTPGVPVWQRNYYERVIRDDRELERAREYILDNPRKWRDDGYFREQPP
jgi:REP element-mobilizing transposase RayT